MLNIELRPDWALSLSITFLLYLILFLPILFLLGWLPQCTTFIMHLCELIHIHVFGGSGTVSTIGAIQELIKDLLGMGILVGVGYYSTWKMSFGKDYYSGIYSSTLVIVSYVV